MDLIEDQPCPACGDHYGGSVDGRHTHQRHLELQMVRARLGDRSGRAGLSTADGVMRRVLVTGSRTWTDVATIRQQWRDGTAVLVSGGCPRGADWIAEDVWADWGGRIERHPADWDRYGRSAGFRRNADMVTASADVCLAFIRAGSRGASHAAELAASVGIPVLRYARTDTT
jgi:hypothetical protein